MSFVKLVMSVKKWIDYMLETKDRIHYSEIAYGLNISLTYARTIAKLLADQYPNDYMYEKGYISKAKR